MYHLLPVLSYSRLKWTVKPFLEKMTAEGVGVRAFEIYGRNWCRVSMGTMDEMKLFTAALEKVLV